MLHQVFGLRSFVHVDSQGLLSGLAPLQWLELTLDKEDVRLVADDLQPELLAELKCFRVEDHPAPHMVKDQSQIFRRFVLTQIDHVDIWVVDLPHH